ncbi:MAG: hypothetical protein Fur0012_11700 [Elusimicrobiota bacterium]
MRNLKFSIAVAANTFLETVNSRLFPFFLVFSLLLVYVSSVLGLMAVDEERRVLTDFGLMIGELTVFSFSLFLSSMAINREMETKTIYLVLARPIGRKTYVLGRTFGLYMVSAFLILSVSAIHLSLLFLRGFSPDKMYFVAIFSSAIKIALITSVAIFASMVTTSSFSGIIISVMIWVFGHFSQEIKHLAEKASGIKKIILLFFMYTLPNFQLLNFRDIPAFYDNILQALVYFVCYSSILVMLASLAFEKKEF